MTTRGLFLNLAFNFEAEDWYAAIAPDLARVLAGLPMWSQWKTVKVRGGKAVKLTAESVTAAAASADRAFELLDPDVGVELECSHFQDTLLLRLEIYDDSWPRHAAALEAIAWQLIEALPAGAVLPISGIMPRFIPDLPWDQLPSRPKDVVVRYENVSIFVDRRLVGRWDDTISAAIARLVDAPAPPGARRVERGSVVMVSFTDALTDEAALADARMRNERWLADRIGASAPDGDRRLDVAEQLDAPPLSFVDPGPRLGFKTVVVFPDGSREDAAWDAAVTIARAGSVEPFGSLAGVYVIVPLREHAVALAKPAHAAGIAGVAYPDERGALWVVT